MVALIPPPENVLRLSLNPLSEGSRHYSDLPRSGCPFNKKVFGNSPSPQILNDPKSLYHEPSGASGSDSRHSLSL